MGNTWAPGIEREGGHWSGRGRGRCGWHRGNRDIGESNDEGDFEGD
jgi:hypothetical protein